jgi:hypothetical protein
MIKKALDGKPPSLRLKCDASGQKTDLHNDRPKSKRSMLSTPV